MRRATAMDNVSKGLGGPDLDGEEGELLFSKDRLPEGGTALLRDLACETL